MDVVDFVEMFLGIELTKDQKRFLLKCYTASSKGEVYFFPPRCNQKN